MFDTVRTPVSVYRSDDANAPRLGGAGSLKTVLKACLTTGYGDKQPLGWAMSFEDGNSAVFKSQHSQSNGCYLKIDNVNRDYALALPYRNMAALDNGEGYFGFSDSYRYVPYGDAGRRWYLIGHERAFTLILQSNDNSGSAMMYFGDVPSLVAADSGNTLFTHSFYSGTRFYTQGLSFLGSSSGGGSDFALAKRWDGVESPVSGNFVSLCAVAAGVPYPDPIGSGLMAGEIYLYEREGSSRYLTRGLLPGWYKTRHDLSAVPDGNIMRLDGSDDAFAKFNLGSGSSHGYLLNITAWEA